MTKPLPRILAHVARSLRCGKWMACLGGGHLQRISVHFWNGNTTQMSSINLGRTFRKLLAAFRTFQHQFSPDGNRNWCNTLLNFLLHCEMWRTLQVDVHWEASTERMWGDTVFRLCKYTYTELPPVLSCCHFAAYYSFSEKKSVPQLND